jgi:hypothetical protein
MMLHRARSASQLCVLLCAKRPCTACAAPLSTLHAMEGSMYDPPEPCSPCVHPSIHYIYCMHGCRKQPGLPWQQQHALGGQWHALCRHAAIHHAQTAATCKAPLCSSSMSACVAASMHACDIGPLRQHATACSAGFILPYVHTRSAVQQGWWRWAPEPAKTAQR